MKCIVTAGPTCEPLDQVRRLTNFSTGRLGIELANYLQARGCDVTLLAARDASWPGDRKAAPVEHFVTSADLREALEKLAGDSVNAVFHAAAVSDFKFGKIFVRSREGQLTPVKAGKISTGAGTLLAELLPAPKIISGLRDWFPKARIIGWKYEVDGNRAAALDAAAKQISECLTDACVANGPAYGEGYGLVDRRGGKAHLEDSAALYEALWRCVK